jgi:hypothetical protein
MSLIIPLVRMPWAALALSALMGLGLCAPASAQWVWKDKNGKVFSQLPPPPSVAEKDILQRPRGATRNSAPQASEAASSAAPQAASSPAKTVDPALEAKRKKAELDEAAKRRAEEEKLKAAKADNCARAKAHLRALDDGMRLSRVNEKGEREILDDKARADESRRTREIVSSDCK